jgi:hypothetical protein
MVDNANNKDFKVRLATVEETRDYDDGVGIRKVTTTTLSAGVDALSNDDKYDDGNVEYNDGEENDASESHNDSFDTLGLERKLLHLIMKVGSS